MLCEVSHPFTETNTSTLSKMANAVPISQMKACQIYPVKHNMKTEALTNSLAQRIKRILVLKGALETIFSDSIIAQTEKPRPPGEVLCHSQVAS